MNKNLVYSRVLELLEPLNKRNIVLSEQTVFTVDMDLDSLAVMEFVAAVEDEWDILIPLNKLPDLENIGQLVDEIVRLSA